MADTRKDDRRRRGQDWLAWLDDHLARLAVQRRAIEREAQKAADALLGGVMFSLVPDPERDESRSGEGAPLSHLWQDEGGGG